MIHLDTSFLVDLLRETARSSPGPAAGLLDDHPEEDLWVSVHVACELLAGAALSRRPSLEKARVTRLLTSLQIAYPDEAFADTYATLLAFLERNGRRIGNMDLLIATAAIVDNAPLVTRNLKDFQQVPGLELLTY